MPLCPQITNTPITVSQTVDYTVTSVIPALPDTSDGLASTILNIGGITVYYQDAEPTDPPNTLKEGDLWFDTDDGNKLYYYNGTAWVSVQDAGIQDAIDLADSKINSFYQTSAPTATAIGDIWFDTDDGYKQYYWTGTAWVSVQDTAIAAAQSSADAAASAATAAQTTANGKNKIYRQTSAPTGTLVDGDLWFDTDDDNRIYRYNGSSWVANNLGNNAIANLSANKLTAGTIDASIITVSNINAGNISTGTLAADRIAAASITGSKLVAGTITATQIATGTITADQIAAATISGSKIAAATITASNIASNTITATQISSAYVYAGTINASQITAGTITGRTVTATAGTKTITLDASNAVLTLSDTSTGFLSGVAISISSSGGRQSYMNSAGIYGGTTSSTVYALDALNELGGYSGIPRFYAPAATSLRIVSDAGLLRSAYPISLEGAVTIFGRADFSDQLYMPNIASSANAANVRWGTAGGGQLFYSTASSIKFKEDVVNLLDVNELDPKALLQLPVRAFRYKAEYLKEPDDRAGMLVPGFIAEEVDAIYPIAADYEKDGPNNWNEKFMIPAMLSLIQDLYNEINILKGGIENV